MSLYIHDWTTVSPLGIGLEDFKASVAMELPRCFDNLEATPKRSTVFESFDKKMHLGKKGVRGMDQLGAYATIASKLLVDRTDVLENHDSSRVGVILGTGTGSLKSQIEFIKELHTSERVEWVNPIQFPQTVMNCAAGQVSIWHKFTGVNATVSSGHHSAVTACNYAENLFAQDRLDWALVGSAEENCEYSSYLYLKNRPNLFKQHSLGEGCAMFLVSRKYHSESIAQVCKFERYAWLSRKTPEERTEILRQLIEESVSGLTESVCRICYNAFSSQDHELVQSLLEQTSVLQSAQPICSNSIVADCFSSTAGFQLCLLLAIALEHPETTQQEQSVDISLTIDTSGGVAITVLKKGN